jgi:hypothetical protein
MNYILIINCILFILSSSGYLILFRLLDYYYNINDFWFSNLLTCILSPVYIFKILLNQHTRMQFKNTFKNNSFKYIFLASILYSFENIVLYYCIISLSLFDYIIFRSSFIIWNIPLFMYFFSKKITKIYLISVLLLIISQINILLNVKNNISVYIILFTCGLISSIYNCMMEHTIKTYNVDIYLYHSIFQFIYFCTTIVQSIKYNNNNSLSIQLFMIYTAISFFTQYYCYIKLSILNIENTVIPANVILSGLEFIRRLIIIIFSCIFFKEDYNLLSGILYTLSSIILCIDYYHSIYKNQLVHIELRETESL